MRIPWAHGWGNARTSSSTQSTVDAVLHVPSSTEWTPDQPMGSGDFAVLRGLDEFPARLNVSTWTNAESIEDAPDRGMAPSGEAAVGHAVEGTVIYDDGGPVEEAVEEAFVQAENAGWTYTDADGVFELTLPRGAASLVVSGPGFEQTFDIDVESGGTTLEPLAITADGSATATAICENRDGEFELSTGEGISAVDSSAELQLFSLPDMP